MAQPTPQTFENHARFVPPYHFVLSLLFLANLGWSIWRLIRTPGVEAVFGLLLAVAFLITFWYLRIFPLAVQDRLIRLEMRLRLQEVLPEDQRGRVGELEVGQLIALRFASDEEMPELVKATLDEGLESRQEIKKRIKSWQADTVRC